MTKHLAGSSIVIAISSLLLLVPSGAMAGGLTSASGTALAALPTVSSLLFTQSSPSPNLDTTSITSIPLTAVGTSSKGAASPGIANPDNCNLSVQNYPHISTTMKRNGVKVYEEVVCSIAPPKQYISVSLYKDTCCGPYLEGIGSNTNYNALTVGASGSVDCSNLTQNTVFFGVASAYSIQQNGVQYSAEGQSVSKTLKCGTRGGGPL